MCWAQHLNMDQFFSPPLAATQNKQNTELPPQAPSLPPSFPNNTSPEGLNELGGKSHRADANIKGEMQRGLAGALIHRWGTEEGGRREGWMEPPKKTHPGPVPWDSLAVSERTHLIRLPKHSIGYLGTFTTLRTVTTN